MTKMHESHESFQRKWRVLPGRNKYLCDGRIIMSRQTGVFYFTVALIVGTMIVFFVQDAPYLWLHASPILPLVALALTMLSLSQLFRTSFSDPGVIPRASFAEAMDIEQQINNEVNQANPTMNQYRPPPRTKEITINGQTFRLKYCFTCKIFRPPRASHCSVCDNCILNFDHHCPWVGNCVGQRNYRHFYLFVLTLSILCIFVFSCSVVHLVLAAQKENNNFLLAIRDSPGSLVVILIAFFSVWSVIGLSGFHTYLLSTGQTTNEDIKGTFSRKRVPEVINPFTKGGLMSNCCGTLCAPTPPSTIDRRGWVQPEQSISVPASLLVNTCAPMPQCAQYDTHEYTNEQCPDNMDMGSGKDSHGHDHDSAGNTHYGALDHSN